MQLTPSGLAALPDEVESGRLHEEFARSHALRLPGLFSPALLDLFLPRVTSAEWAVRLHEGVENERVLASQSLLSSLFFLFNEPALFALVRRISGCGEIVNFSGRVGYRHKVDAGGSHAHHYPWHDDVKDDRMVGLSLNLSREPYQGGVFQLRKQGTTELLFEHANTGLGDAMLFRVDAALEHHVTRVESRAPRMILVGWFHGTKTVGEPQKLVPDPTPAIPAQPLAPAAHVRVPPTMIFHADGSALRARTVNDGLHHRLDGVGRQMWEALASLGSVAAARDALLKRYDAPPEELTAELLRFGGLLRDKGLLEEIPD